MDPSLCRKPASEVDENELKRPSIRARPPAIKDDIMASMWGYSICGVVEDEEVWRHAGVDVENCLFGVEESGNMVQCLGGKSRQPLCTIMHMKPSKRAAGHDPLRHCGNFIRGLLLTLTTSTVGEYY